MNRWFQQLATVAVAAMLLMLPVSTTTLAGASQAGSQSAAPATNSPVGDWSDTYSYCTSGWCKGQSFHNPTTITAYAPSSGDFSGVDAGFRVVGQMHGAAFTMTIGGGGGYTAWVTGSITFSAEKTTWDGTWTDSNHVGGTWKGTRAPVDLTIAGTIVGQQCGASSCTTTGIAGQAILAIGTAQDGTAVSRSDRSDAAGAWSVQVPPGTYTVGPSADGTTIDGTDFTPPDVQLTVTADVSDLKFVTCAGSASSESTVSLSAASLMSVAGPAVRPNGAALADQHATASDTALTCPPDSIDWKMLGDTTTDVPRLAGSDPLGMLPTSDIYQPLVVHLFLTLHGKPYDTCSAKTDWKWQVTAKSAGAKVLTKESGPLVGCSVNVLVTTSGTYHVVATEYPKGKTKALRKPVAGDVMPKNLLIVAMGDSNGSGEGYPPFYFNQCDRGVASYQYQAAQLLEAQSGGHATVTFVSASCSGARTQHLVDTNYPGIVAGTPLAPQIQQLEDQLAPPSGAAERKVDAAVISIGVNNIAFGPLLEYCVKYTATKTASDLARAQQRSQGGAAPVLPPDPYPWLGCESTPVSVVGDGTGGVAKITLDRTSHKTLSQAISQLVAALPQRYDEVAAALDQSGLVDPGEVYISQYPAFWYADSNDVCGGPPASPYPSNTWEWLGVEGLKLNGAVASAAADHGWNVIRVPGYYFYAHGYCKFTDSWFVPIYKGLYYNAAGAFHPTERGAHVTAVMALHLLCPLLGEAKRCTSFPEP